MRMTKQGRLFASLSAELGFLQVAKTFVKKYPGLLTVKTIAPKKKTRDFTG